MAEIILDENIHLNLDELVSYCNQVKGTKLKYKDISRIFNQQHGIPLSLRRLKNCVDRKH